jgi:ABC-type antimicrobial peptide transport system permease subunit
VGRLDRAALKKCRDISRSSIIEAPTSQVKPVEVNSLHIRLQFAAAALLTQETNCATDPHNAACGFDSTLHLLHILIAILSIVLIVVIAAAIAAYRKMQRKKLIP